MSEAFIRHVGRFFGGIKFSTQTALVVPTVTQRTPETVVKHLPFSENVPGVRKFIHRLNETGLNRFTPRTRFGNGIVGVEPTSVSFNVTDVKTAPKDRVTFIVEEVDDGDMSAELVYESRGNFMVEQRAQMELKEEDGWLSVHTKGLSTIMITAGVELIAAIAEPHEIPLPDGKIGEKTFLNMIGLFTEHELIKMDRAAGYPTVLSREKVRVLGMEPQPVVALSYNPEENSISIENNVPLGPFGLEKPYEPLIVELMEAAAGLRGKFPL
jgi:hypothetical protein